MTTGFDSLTNWELGEISTVYAAKVDYYLFDSTTGIKTYLPLSEAALHIATILGK
jgi:hypothetical protein